MSMKYKGYFLFLQERVQNWQESVKLNEFKLY